MGTYFQSSEGRGGDVRPLQNARADFFRATRLKAENVLASTWLSMRVEDGGAWQREPLRPQEQNFQGACDEKY